MSEAWAGPPTPVYVHTAPPPPPDRFRIGNQYYDRGELAEYLLDFEVSYPYIAEMQRQRRAGIGLIVGGAVLELAIMGVFMGIGIANMDNFGLFMGMMMGGIFGGLAVGLGMMLGGGAKLRKSKKQLMKAVNAYNGEDPDEPIVIETFSMLLHPVVVRGGGGLGLSAAF